MTMDAPDSPAGTGGGGTPRKSLWRSASWCARSSPAGATITGPMAKHRPAPIRLPPLCVPRCTRGWPLPAPADTCSTPSPSASSLVDGDLSLAVEHIYLGGDAAARDRDLLRRHGITHVLNCAGFACPERFAGELRYRTLWLRDHPGEDIVSLLYDVFDFLEEVRARPRGRALVHCSRGTSRSVALVVAYLMWRRALPFEDALRLVRAARPAADPNPGFVSQLVHWQRRILACPPQTTPQVTSPCVYRMAPHSPYDPLHLVPKMVDRSGRAELDTRGAFLVHEPSSGRGTVYLWVGADCEPAMAASAGATARQVLRYERARGPIMAIDEGSEPAEFWEALGYPAASDDPDLSMTARRKRMEAYDLDFEIYRRALKGGPATPAAPSSTAEGGSSTPRPRMNPNNNDYVDAAIPFGSPSSLSAGSVTPTSSEGSTLFTYSPASSSSDWYRLSPGSDLSYGEAPSLCSPRRPLPPCAPTLTEGNSGSAPSLLSRANIGGCENAGDPMGDWPFSPYPLGRGEDDGSPDIDQAMPSELGQSVEADGATLYHWQPCPQKVEMLHPGVLNSGSVFLLLAPKTSLAGGELKTLFVWVGKNYRLSVDDHGGGKEDDDCQAFFKRIGADFLNQMTLPVDIPVQVIREDKEPEEFLNHLFTFQQINESSKDEEIMTVMHKSFELYETIMHLHLKDTIKIFTWKKNVSTRRGKQWEESGKKPWLKWIMDSNLSVLTLASKRYPGAILALWFGASSPCLCQQFVEASSTATLDMHAKPEICSVRRRVIYSRMLQICASYPVEPAVAFRTHESTATFLPGLQCVKEEHNALYSVLYIMR